MLHFATMIIPLEDLTPEWLDKDGRMKVGLRFLCPEHQACHVDAWFLNPLDGGQPASDNDLHQLYTISGEEFKSLSLTYPIKHHDLLLVVNDGAVGVLYL